MMETVKKTAQLKFLILSVILLCFLFSGCGKKAPPKPPVKEKPSTVNRLSLF